MTESNNSYEPRAKPLAQKRHNDFTKAIRKQNICIRHYGFNYYSNLHQYSKNKIHCSCPLCASKTGKGKSIWKNEGIDGKNWKHSDLIKITKMMDEEREYNEKIDCD